MHDDEDTRLDDLNASPLNPLPGAVWLLLLAIAGIEVALQLAHFGVIGGSQGIGWRIEAIQRFAYSSSVQDWMLENRRFPGLHMVRYLGFSFVHTGAMHAVFALVLVAALGKMLAERFGALRFLALALAVPSLAAILFGLILGPDELGWLIGAMPMVFGLVGGWTWLQWSEAGADSEKRRRAFALIGLLLAARLGFGLFGEAGPAWVAELIAFALGFMASAAVLGPGSWHRTRVRLRGE